jgi:hypothetical protein
MNRPFRRLTLRYVLSTFLLPPTLPLGGSGTAVAQGEVAERTLEAARAGALGRCVCRSRRGWSVAGAFPATVFL